MVSLTVVGLFFILLSGIVNAVELRKFFKALNILNQCTRTMKDKILYPIRLIKISKYLSPIIPDIILMLIGGGVGLSGGVTGFIISMGGTCALTLIIKIAIKLNKPKCRNNFDLEIQKL